MIIEHLALRGTIAVDDAETTNMRLTDATAKNSSSRRD